MSDIAIRVENLSKLYHIGATQERHDTLRDAVTGFFRRAASDRAATAASAADTDLWALKDVSFDVKQGEVVGIIGRNGAGKSTLLKILSRITEPTSGRVTLHGRVASLLEVGTGFHPELTGRENIYLNGAILGMKRREIDRKFDEIVTFAEIERFLDTPVKRYSSGMYVRLAFAVAAHLEPEILLVDEVLAVGDAAFQKKCLGKMGDVSREGRAVLFVSHNMTAVNSLCAKCLWIDAGDIRQAGTTANVVHAYLTPSGISGFSSEMDLGSWPSRYGTGEARIRLVRLLNEQGRLTAEAYRSRPITVEFVLDSNCGHALSFSSIVTTDTGDRVLYVSHHDTPHLMPGVLNGRYLIRFIIDTLPLCAGSYKLTLGVHTTSMVPVDVVTDVLPFNVEDCVDSPRPYKITVQGAYCWALSRWSIVAEARKKGDK